MPIEEFLDCFRPRSRQLAQCCRVVLTTRVRRAESMYVSMFNWGVATRRRSHNFSQWAPANLQSVLLLWGQYRQWLDGNLNPGGARWYASFGESTHQRLLAMLRDDFDLVYPLERSADGLTMLADALRLPQWAAGEMRAVQPMHVRPMISGANHPEKLGNTTAVVQKLSGLDSAMYTNITEHFARRWLGSAAAHNQTATAPPSAWQSCRCAHPAKGQALDQLAVVPAANMTDRPCGIQPYRPQGRADRWRLGVGVADGSAQLQQLLDVFKRALGGLGGAPRLCLRTSLSSASSEGGSK